MTDLNRRHLLAGAAAMSAAAVTGLGPTTANASVPQAGTQAPGFYRYKVGSFECTSINDGARTFPMPEKFVANIPKEEALAAGEAAYMPKGMVTVPFNPQLINTGSKQGITNPPGNPAYNVSKAGVKALTEALAHELRGTPGCELSAHLLVPGFTYTGMVKRFLKEKPPSAWLPEQVADHLLAAMDRGDFYVLCPDNDVTPEMDNRRMEWAVGDLIENRPALSRWHPDYEAAFEAFMAKKRD